MLEKLKTIAKWLRREIRERFGSMETFGGLLLMVAGAFLYYKIITDMAAVYMWMMTLISWGAFAMGSWLTWVNRIKQRKVIAKLEQEGE